MSQGVRSIQHRWMGGSSQSPFIARAGVRSMQAFWMGGAAMVAIPTPPTGNQIYNFGMFGGQPFPCITWES